MAERIQKLISAAGICSRRRAEELILSGRVTVNGELANLGDSADLETDDVRVDGKPVGQPPGEVYIMLNKPRGCVTTMDDERGRRIVAELVKDVGTRVFPIGRLDMDSEGLLLLTNDGKVANAIMHPSHEIVKMYRVSVTGMSLDSSLERLRGEFSLDGHTVQAVRFHILKREDKWALVSIGIKQGLNRQIRRMCDISGLKVKSLRRVKVGELGLGKLRRGEWRYLSEEEIAYVKSVADKLQI